MKVDEAKALIKQKLLRASTTIQAVAKNSTTEEPTNQEMNVLADTVVDFLVDALVVFISIEEG
jgi:hypothetical protein